MMIGLLWVFLLMVAVVCFLWFQHLENHVRKLRYDVREAERKAKYGYENAHTHARAIRELADVREVVKDLIELDVATRWQTTEGFALSGGDYLPRLKVTEILRKAAVLP